MPLRSCGLLANVAMMSKERDRARSLEPVEPHQRPIRMKKAIDKVWIEAPTGSMLPSHSTTGGSMGPDVTTACQPDVILPSPEKADLQ
jgi:hypothetical protein